MRDALRRTRAEAREHGPPGVALIVLDAVSLACEIRRRAIDPGAGASPTSRGDSPRGCASRQMDGLVPVQQPPPRQECGESRPQPGPASTDGVSNRRWPAYLGTCDVAR